ncbi:MAG: methyltransferase domain-containing protein [Lentilitoribacter sp.]
MDEEKLADAYNKALALEKAGDFEAAAISYQEVLKLDPDDHGGASVRLASMKMGGVPDKAPQSYITTLFDQHAEVFDKVLVDDLGYDVPSMSAELLKSLNMNAFKHVLDLGCGTGLMGVQLEDISDEMIGVDLSENMVEIAYDRDIYEGLYVADVEDYLDENDEELFDLICAGDVLPYLGNVENFIKGISDNLIANGHTIFSTETLPDEEFSETGFTIGAHQRYAHKLSYLDTILKTQSLSILISQDIVVRHEQGKPINGHLILAQKLNTRSK